VLLHFFQNSHGLGAFHGLHGLTHFPCSGPTLEQGQLCPSFFWIAIQNAESKKWLQIFCLQKPKNHVTHLSIILHHMISYDGWVHHMMGWGHHMMGWGHHMMGWGHHMMGGPII
jgi:hypothetical protein